MAREDRARGPFFPGIAADRPFPGGSARIAGDCIRSAGQGEEASVEQRRIETAAGASGLPAALDVVVLGAGIAGLAAARALAAAGGEVLVLDKGRGPGGRASTRRSGVHAFDHGAQYFTAREPHFRTELERWQLRGLAARWDGRIVALGPDGPRACAPLERHVGVPGMSALARELARGLEVRQGVRVAACERRAGLWELLDERGSLLARSGTLVVSAPPAQSAALIGPRSPLGALAAAAELLPCVAVMAAFEGRVPANFDGAFCAGPELAWAARDSSKPGRAPGERWVLHATPAWSARELERDPAELAPLLLAAFARELGGPLPPLAHLEAHRWRFASPGRPVELARPVDLERGLVLAGDWLGGGRIEGAYLSGLAAAEAVLATTAGTAF